MYQNWVILRTFSLFASRAERVRTLRKKKKNRLHFSAQMWAAGGKPRKAEPRLVATARRKLGAGTAPTQGLKAIKSDQQTVPPCVPPDTSDGLLPRLSAGPGCGRLVKSTQLQPALHPPSKLSRGKRSPAADSSSNGNIDPPHRRNIKGLALAVAAAHHNRPDGSDHPQEAENGKSNGKGGINTSLIIKVLAGARRAEEPRQLSGQRRPGPGIRPAPSRTNGRQGANNPRPAAK